MKEKWEHNAIGEHLVYRKTKSVEDTCRIYFDPGTTVDLQIISLYSSMA